MSDIPNVPVAPVVVTPPVVQTTVTANTVKAPIVVDGKGTDLKTVEKVAVTPAEKEIIRKIKVGEMEYDETTLAGLIEKSKGADKKFLEAAQARKEAIRFFKLAKENPREFLEKTGLDPKKFAYDEVAKDIQDKLRDPKEVELEKAQARLKEFETKEADAKKQTEDAKLAKQAEALEQRFHAEAIAALEKHPAIPKNGFSVAKMAKYIETVQQKTGVTLSFEEVAGVIESDIRSEVKGVMNGAAVEQIIELLGEDTMTAIRKYDLAKLKDPLKGGNGVTTSGNEKTKPKWKNSTDFWKSIDKATKAERGE